MKYGIKFTDRKGDETYVASSRSSPTMSENLSDIALFNTEAKAIAGGRKILLNGYCTNGRLEVIEIQFVIKREIPVPASKPKIGFAIHRSATSRFDQYYFTSGQWTNKERCKVFKTEQLANSVLAQLIVDTQTKLDSLNHKSGWYSYRDSTQRYLDQLKAATVIQLS